LWSQWGGGDYTGEGLLEVKMMWVPLCGDDWKADCKNCGRLSAASAETQSPKSFPEWQPAIWASGSRVQKLELLDPCVDIEWKKLAPGGEGDSEVVTFSFWSSQDSISSMSVLEEPAELRLHGSLMSSLPRSGLHLTV
jgi:hypothetical protein